MSWIDDEADKDEAKVTGDNRTNEVIQTSNLWARLIHQLKSDMEKINANPHWNNKLAGSPLRFETILDRDGGYSFNAAAGLYRCLFASGSAIGKAFVLAKNSLKASSVEVRAVMAFQSHPLQ